MRSFRLSDAQCFSDADRDAILRLVGRWWTEQTAGELEGLSPSSAEARPTPATPRGKSSIEGKIKWVRHHLGVRQDVAHFFYSSKPSV